MVIILRFHGISIKQSDFLPYHNFYILCRCHPREVQELRDEVRESPEVRFALSVYSALNSNNYIKFFKLVKRAPYLMACIIHRYFTQVRSVALIMMLKAYRAPGSFVNVSTVVPLF